MPPNQSSGLSENSPGYLNHLHAGENGVEGLFGSWESTWSRGVLKRESCLAFHRGNFTGAGIARTENR